MQDFQQFSFVLKSFAVQTHKEGRNEVFASSTPSGMQWDAVIAVLAEVALTAVCHAAQTFSGLLLQMGSPPVTVKRQALELQREGNLQAQYN